MSESRRRQAIRNESATIARTWKAAYETADSFEMQGADAPEIVKALKAKWLAALKSSEPNVPTPYDPVKEGE